mmetsp:Transcript_42485/g.96161  ORF Transcript_42485/g.96161 Transcript_42485/m.96161 type:complete len:112 (+) Transcript_42485:263-598(+)
MKQYKAGVVPVKQVLLERGLIQPETKVKGECGAKNKKMQGAIEDAGGAGKGELIDFPKHGEVDAESGDQCCLAYLMSQQPDFLNQKSAIREYIESRGHFCIFSPNLIQVFI